MGKKAVVISVILIGLMIVVQVLAGSLEPSAGPNSTMKTLDEVEPRIPIPGSASAIGPFEINNPGSYYLTGDRTCDGNGINVNVDDVTIDLMGYQLIGPGNESGTNYGIYMNERNNVEIRNGTIRNFGSHGIYETNDGDDGCLHRVINIRVRRNGGIGINLVAGASLIKDCYARINFEGGIAAVDPSEGRGDSTIIHCTAIYNFGNGISAGRGSTVIGCTSNRNQGGGIVTDRECTIKDCTARQNHSGIVAGAGNVIKGCTAGSNWDSGDVYGISAGVGSTVVGNSACDNTGGNAYGIYLNGYNLVDQNTAYNNSGTNMTLGVTGCVYVNNVAP